MDVAEADADGKDLTRIWPRSTLTYKVGSGRSAGGFWPLATSSRIAGRKRDEVYGERISPPNA